MTPKQEGGGALPTSSSSRADAGDSWRGFSRGLGGGGARAGVGMGPAGGSRGSPLSAIQGEKVDPLMAAAGKVAMAAASHPVDYAKTLIQIGYEPIPPVQCKTLFGRPALALPSVFRYVGHIRKRDGFLGLYAGFGPRILEMGAAHYTTVAFNKYWPDQRGEESLGRRDITDPEEQAKMWRVASRASAHRFAIVVTTQPLQVIMVRCMAQFVGREEKYNGPISAIREVLEQNGLLGFWSGLIPRLIGEISMVWLTTAIVHFLNRYVFTEPEHRAFASHIGGFVASSFVYPLQVVSKTMIVSSSGLAAGYPPHMPFYRSWYDCYSHLKSLNQHKRGGSLIFRYYTGPQVVVGDRVVAVNKSVFQLK